MPLHPGKSKVVLIYLHKVSIFIVFVGAKGLGSSSAICRLLTHSLAGNLRTYPRARHRRAYCLP